MHSVDDAELVSETAAAGALDRFIRGARDAGRLLVMAGSADEMSVGFRGFVIDARRARTGLLMNPRGPLDGEVLGVLGCSLAGMFWLLLPFFESDKPARTRAWITGLSIFALVYVIGMSIYGYVAN